MEEKLLRMCGYAHDAESLARLERIKKNYSQFDALVAALLDLEPFLQHSDYYLSLLSDRDMIKIKNDLLEGDEFMMMDSDIVVWANQHNIELEEESDKIYILGFKHEE